MNSFLNILKSLLQIPFFRQIWVLWKTITAGWRIYLEEPVPVDEITYSREAASIPSFGFFFLLISATIIATLGLLANSAAVIIGAMIVAPLMNPILSMSFAIVTGNWRVYKRSLVTVFLGVFCTILCAYLLAILLPIDTVGSEIIARTSPSLIDLGIAIAAGAAGSFSLTRKSIASSIAGVAIAVALVPPLCVAGIGLGIGSELSANIGQVKITNLSVAEGAFLLFLANLAGITFTACLVFLSQSYGNLKQAFQSILIWLLIIALLSGPLSHSLWELFIYSRVDIEIQKLRSEHPEVKQKAHTDHISVKLEGDTAYITIITIAPKGLLTEEYRQNARQKLFDALSNMGVKSMDIVLKTVPVEIEEHQLISK
ncbi:MAG: DUF389 domain-containing protein [Xenococcus sp. MO_188.B8]|nr:DUF389 domain-containing protein [Xenococcus sp. MO_188.B8]